MKQISQILSELSSRLESVSDTYSLDAQVLLSDIIGKPRSWILAHPEAPLSAEQQQNIQTALERLEAGEPLPYVIGHWDFYGLDFDITPAVLIPRPETEILVERALTWLNQHPNKHFAADIGTGSGCIAVTLAKEVPDLTVAAIDISEGALQVAQRNAIKHGVSQRIQLIRSDLLTELDPSHVNQFDLICANLPYIPQGELDSLEVSKWEPTQALDGGLDGLDMIKKLLQSAPNFLAPGGLILLEIESSMGDVVFDLAKVSLTSSQIHLLTDLAGLDRVVEIQRV